MAWLALAVFSLFLAAFASVAFAPHVQSQYYPAWGGAAWIGPNQPATVANYRKSIFLPSEPVKAHLQVAAPDQFTLFVNGVEVPGKRSAFDGSTAANVLVSASTSEIFDVAPYLRTGKNVIAIAVKLWTRPARPQLIVRGSWMDRARTISTISSDGNWRVVTFDDWQPAARGRTNWYDPQFVDYDLPFAVNVEELPDRPMQYLDTPPALFQVFPRGDWIWHRERAAQKAAFRRTFDLQGKKIEEAWIGISSDASYSLAVNGFQIEEATTGPSMHAINIARYLRWGENTVTLGMTRLPPQKSPRLAVALVASVDGNRLDLSSDGRWLSSADEPPDARWTPVAIAGAMGIVPLLVEAQAQAPATFGYPGVGVIDVSPPYEWWLALAVKVAVWTSAVLAVNIILVWLSGLLFYRQATHRKTPPWATWLYVSVGGTLALCFLFLLQYDVRIAQSAVLRPAIFFVVWGAAVISVGIAVAWSYRRHRRTVPPDRGLESR